MPALLRQKRRRRRGSDVPFYLLPPPRPHFAELNCLERPFLARCLPPPTLPFQPLVVLRHYASPRREERKKKKRKKSKTFACVLLFRAIQDSTKIGAAYPRSAISSSYLFNFGPNFEIFLPRNFVQFGNFRTCASVLVLCHSCFELTTTPFSLSLSPTKQCYSFQIRPPTILHTIALSFPTHPSISPFLLPAPTLASPLLQSGEEGDFNFGRSGKKTLLRFCATRKRRRVNIEAGSKNNLKASHL